MSDKPVLTGPSYAPDSEGPAKQIVIFLHGVGANGDDLIGLAPVLSRSLPNTQFLAPNAPEPCDMGPFGYQWFSLQDRSPSAIESGVRASADLVNKFIDDSCELYNVEPNKVALFGFSQGCMMSLFVGLRRERELAAILGYSGTLVAPEKLSNEIVSRPPVLLVHGEEDQVVPFHMFERAKAGLLSAGVDVNALSRPGVGHGIDEEGLGKGLELLVNQLL